MSASSIWSRVWPAPVDHSKPDPKGERGAIMVMGVFLACSMIAAMWYMMGIGDAILWRDRQQEAADSIAFTSAAVHARGLNFIAMINIIMLLIVAVFLIACILRSVLDLILYVTGDCTSIECEPVGDLEYTKGHGAISALTTIGQFFLNGDNVPRFGDAKCGGGSVIKGVLGALGMITENTIDNSAGRDLAIACAECGVWACATIVCPIGECIANHPMHDLSCEVGQIYNKVEKFIEWWEENVMKLVLPKLHSVEVATSVLTPWVAAGVSVWSGFQYKDGPSQEPSTKIGHKGIALSPSMFRHMKKPDKVKVLDPSLQWIKCANTNGCGNGCGPTLCNDGKLSRSGGRKTGTSGTTAECCSPGTAGCTLSGTCSQNNGVAADQSKMYIETTVGTGDYRIGLPVQGQNMNELCEKSFSFLGDGIQGMMNGYKSGLTNGGNASSDGSTMSTSGKKSGGSGSSQSSGGMIQKLFAGAGSWFKKAYCTWDPTFSAAHSTVSGCDPCKDVFPGPDGDWNGGCSPVCASNKCPDDANDFWAINDTDKCPFVNEIGHKIPILLSDGDHGGGNGPMKVVDYAPNGEDYNQVYAIVLNDNYNPFYPEYNGANANTQTAWSKIRLGAGVKGWNKDSSTDDTTGMGLDGNGPWFYLAEAEFYHDCESNWTDTECNGNDHATYRLNWRTRLRRLRRPIYIKDLTDKIPSGVKDLANFASKYAWEINQLSVNLGGGMDLTQVIGLFETITEVGTSDPNGLMPPLYH